jgi:hypothetical protein
MGTQVEELSKMVVSYGRENWIGWGGIMISFSYCIRWIELIPGWLMNYFTFEGIVNETVSLMLDPCNIVFALFLLLAPELTYKAEENVL